MIGTFNFDNYIKKLYEEADANTVKGYTEGSEKDGILLPDDTKKNFDWLKAEYQKGKTEVKVEVKGEGSSFNPRIGYHLQTDLKSVKDFKPGMYGNVKTSDNETSKPITPDNKKEKTSAEDKIPEDNNKSTDDTIKKSVQTPKVQTMKVDITSKNKKDDK